MNLAIFGGSFDPPHLGHDSVIKVALENLDIEKLIIFPTFISPFKDTFFAPPQLRFKWALKIWGKLERVFVSNFEILQKRQVPTIESVIFFKNEYNCEKIYLIIGADQLSSLHKWYNFDQLCKLVKFVVATRDDIAVPSDFIKLNVDIKISSTMIRQGKGLNLIPKIIRDEVIKFIKEKNAK